MATLLDKFQVAPPSATAQELLLPLTFFDVIWLPFHPIRRLLFYEIPCSKDDFMDTLVPKLRTSLSLALKHYPPLAGRIVLHPSNSADKPSLRYLAQDDFVTLSAFQSDKDFDTLVANFPRDSDQFYDLIPPMPAPTMESDRKLLHLLAVQVTLFQGRGICIGVANHHSVGDATSVVGFLRCWANICKLGGDDDELRVQQGQSPPPTFDRSLIKDTNDVASVILNQVKHIPPEAWEMQFPTFRIRATYNFSQADIQKLKDSILKRDPGFLHLSSFVVTAASVWTSLAKSLDKFEEIADDEPEFFLFAADCRSRVDPPLPPNYFGNCVYYGLAKVPHVKLVDDEGFFVAAEEIALSIKNRLNNKERVAKDPENWVPEILQAIQHRLLSVAGSAKVDLYGLDFGWGGARKFESPSIDQDKYSFSLCRDAVGGLEVGISLPEDKMAIFDEIFAAGRDGCLIKQTCIG